MGTSAKTLARISGFVDKGLLPHAGSIIELGAQQLRCAPDDLRAFFRYFSADTTNVEELCNEGYLGLSLLRAGFRYVSLDIFKGIETTLFDLNLQFAPADMIGQFDLVTNYGTTEHIINQMLAMRTMHDLAKPGGLIHHTVPTAGYHLHGYFNYNPGLFDDLAAANQYEVVFSSFEPGVRKAVPDFMRERGYREGPWRDYMLEIVLRKTTDAPFRIPVDTISSVEVSDAMWTAGADQKEVGVTINSPADAAVTLARLPFRTLQTAYFSKLRRGITERLWRLTDRR